MTAALQLFSTLGKWSAPQGAFPGSTLEPRQLVVLRVLDIPRFPGPARIAGTVKVIDTLAPGRRVRLYDKASGRLARTVISDGAGAYAFENIDERRTYYVTAEDVVPSPFNATIEDFVVPA